MTQPEDVVISLETLSDSEKIDYLVQHVGWLSAQVHNLMSNLGSMGGLGGMFARKAMKP